jgi:hypothetical protein
MTTVTAVGGPAGPAGDEAERCLHAVAGELTACGFVVTGPVWGDTCQSEITGIGGGHCEMDLMGTGALVWEYIPLPGALTPDEAVRLVLALLGRTGPACRGVPAPRHPGVAFKGAVGRALAACGMAVRLVVVHLDHRNYEIFADVEVTNPAQPARGRARVSDEGEIRWECSFATPASPAAGLAPRDIAQTIATALGGGSTAS